MNINYAIENLLKDNVPNKEAILYCLNTNQDEQEILFKNANELTQKIYCNTIFISGIIDFYNY